MYCLYMRSAEQKTEWVRCFVTVGCWNALVVPAVMWVQQAPGPGALFWASA